MNYIDYLTPAGKRKHGKMLSLNELTYNHVQKQAKSFSISWENTDFLINLENSKFKTIIGDCKHGLVAVPQSPEYLLKEMVAEHPFYTMHRLNQIAAFEEIHEYKPIVYGGLAFSPLKSTGGKHTSWISISNIANHMELCNQKGLQIQFQNSNNPVLVDITEYFLKKRRNETEKVQRFHDSMHCQYRLASTDDYQDEYKRTKYKGFKEHPTEFEAFCVRDSIKRTLDEVGYAYTPEILDGLVKKQMV